MAIKIEGLRKGVVLAALYNFAIPAALHGGYPKGPMDQSEADELTESETRFDYVNGRALFVDLSGDLLITEKYDAANGPGLAAMALAPFIAQLTREPTPEEDRAFAASILATGLIPRMQK